MRKEEPGLGGPLVPFVAQHKILPFEAAATSNWIGREGLGAARYCETPAFEFDWFALIHHRRIPGGRLVLHSRPAVRCLAWRNRQRERGLSFGQYFTQGAAPAAGGHLYHAREALLSPLLQTLGIELPIIQAPMAGISTPGLAAAVSNAGGGGRAARSGSAPSDAEVSQGMTALPSGPRPIVRSTSICSATVPPPQINPGRRPG